MITLVGVGHIFNLQEAIDIILEDRRPSAVALELDRYRYMALRQEKQGKGGGVYGMLAKYQQSLAAEYGTTPGGEMIAAADKAKSIGAAVALVDMDAQQTFKRLWDSMKFKEKLYMFFGSFGGLFIRKKRMKKEIEHLQEDPEAFIGQLEKQLPTAKTVLIDERNVFMANKIQIISEKYGNVVVFVGDGHIPGLDAIIKGDKEIIRLKNLVDMDIPPSPYTPETPTERPTATIDESGTSASVSFGNQ